MSEEAFIGYMCSDCGKRLGRKVRDAAITTLKVACEICGVEQYCAPARDYGWPKVSAVEELRKQIAAEKAHASVALGTTVDESRVAESG
jgi:DNA-directed RNA polymerase subunit RPC12/RpoP